jgi:tRNA(Ile)-lysidine synthase
VSPAALERFQRDLCALIGGSAARVVVAVSGGADSLALLLLTHAALGGRCVAATVDHGLRTGSAEEARFVASVCNERGIEHVTLSGPLPERVDGSANLSGRARALRYDLLKASAQQHGDAWIATAHHADDQLETLVMRLNRGAGLAGLAGVRRRNGRVIRPLLDWRRAELAEIVAQTRITPVADPTNVDDRYDRARLRKRLADAPWLDTGRAAASAAALADAEDALQWTAERLFQERATRGDDHIDVEPAGLPCELRRRLLQLAVERLQPDLVITGPGLTGLLQSLDHGGSGMLGDVLASVDRNGRWHLRPAPPRRSL